MRCPGRTLYPGMSILAEDCVQAWTLFMQDRTIRNSYISFFLTNLSSSMTACQPIIWKMTVHWSPCHYLFVRNMTLSLLVLCTLCFFIKDDSSIVSDLGCVWWGVSCTIIRSVFFVSWTIEHGSAARILFYVRISIQDVSRHPGRNAYLTTSWSGHNKLARIYSTSHFGAKLSLAFLRQPK